LSGEWHFPLAIPFHFPDLVLNGNGLVDHVLEVGVVGVEQLELNVIIQSTQDMSCFFLSVLMSSGAYLDN
jgi:hypothetical protein